MIRKNRYQPKNCSPSKQGHTDSTSTDSSDSPRCYVNQRGPVKEKLELCKKFIEFGFCPYRNKCKFAHGSHELRKNNQKNSLYKTKECVVYFRDGFCGYGDRCNFLHHKKVVNTAQKTRQKRLNFREIFEDQKSNSKLLELL